jgi:ribosomal silencing factor RsfS
MNPLRRYPVLASLLRPFRRSQQKTCAALVAALCQAAQASGFAIVRDEGAKEVWWLATDLTDTLAQVVKLL